MEEKALGLIESIIKSIGLTPAVEAADTAVKFVRKKELVEAITDYYTRYSSF